MLSNVALPWSYQRVGSRKYLKMRLHVRPGRCLRIGTTCAYPQPPWISEFSTDFTCRTRSVNAQGNVVVIRRALNRLEAAKGDHLAAESHFRGSLSADASLRAAHYSLILLHRDAGNWGEARREAKPLIEDEIRSAAGLAFLRENTLGTMFPA
jgi:hypothetical protein